MDKTNKRDNYISCATAILKTAIEDIDRLGAGSATTTGPGVYSSSSQPSTIGVNTINNNVRINQSLQSRAQDNFWYVYMVQVITCFPIAFTVKTYGELLGPIGGGGRYLRFVPLVVQEILFLPLYYE